jgi:hypothetical protein
MTWAREARRGITSSLLVPAALLAAALVVAFGGAGADALSSLGQLATGPAVPLSSVDSVSRGAAAGADISDLDSGVLASADSAKRRSSRSKAKESAERSRGDAGGSSRTASGSGRSGGGGSGNRSSGGTAGPGGGGGAAPAPASPQAPTSGQAPSGNNAPSSPSRPNPLGDTLDQTQQQLDKLLQPVKPITDGVLGGLGR